MDEPVIELDAEQAASRRRDADWVRKCVAGDQQAFGQLYDAWFDRVFDLVNRVVRDRDVAAEVSQEAFFSAWRNIGTLEKPDAFGGWLLRIARNGAYNRNQKEQRSYAVDDQGLSVIESVGASPAGAPSGFGVEDRLGRAVTPGAAVEDAEIVSLVWQAAEALPERDLEVLDLQLRHGLTPAEIGDVMGMNRNAANQLVHRLKNRLETAIRARVLWRGGSPSCEVLAQRLRDLGIVRFSADAVRVTERHVPGCVECDERQRLNLEPAALFAAVPLFIVPLTIKQAAAAALATAGVPMGGSAFLAAAGLAGQAAAGAAGAGHAAANLGSSVGGAIDPTIGSNVGQAISAPGATNVSLGGNVGHAIAPANPASTLGAQAGSSVGGALPGAGPGSGLGSAAGQSLAPPAPFGSAADVAGDAAHAGDAAKVAGDAAGADHAAESAATFASPPPGGGGGPAPIPPPPPPPSGGTPRMLMLAGAAAGLLILLFLGGLWWGGRGDDPELIASGTPPTAFGTATSSTSTTAGSGTTSTDPTTTDTSADTTLPGDPTTTGGTPTTGNGNTPTTKGGTPTTSNGNTPTTQGNSPTTPPTTTRSTPPTTQPATTTTTTTTPPPVITSSITNNPKLASNWYITGPNSTPTSVNAPPVLSWSVTPSAGFTTEVTGPATTVFPGAGPPTVVPFLKTTPTGTAILCPGASTVTGSGRACGANNGSYNYVITVKNAAGQVVATKTETFVVNAPIIG